MTGTKIEEMTIYPAAGRDSMRLSLRGAQGPFFIRNIVLLTDSRGRQGLGETAGGTEVGQLLESVRPLIENSLIAQYKNTLQKAGHCLRKRARHCLPARGKAPDTLASAVLVALEAALLDLLGQELVVPAAALLGDGQQRDRVKIYGSLFYIGDQHKTDLPYLEENESLCPWYRRRREEALTPAALASLAETAGERYGIRDFKLKGGVFLGRDELEGARAVRKSRGAPQVAVAPGGCWTFEEALALRGSLAEMAYCEAPVGAEEGFSVRETIAGLKTRLGAGLAVRLDSMDWREIRHILRLESCDILLTDQRAWTMGGSVLLGQLCRSFDLAWGACLDAHFDISLAMLCHTAAAIPGEILPLDSPWIWQEGRERLSKQPYDIAAGQVVIPDKPGLGLEVDRKRLDAAKELYERIAPIYLSEEANMQYLLPGWRYSARKPCLVR